MGGKALQCPNGHVMQPHPAGPTTQCDGCKRRFSEGEESNWCRACDYELCKECNKTLRCPNGHGLQARPAGPTTTCDGCKGRFSEGEESKWCRACNCDLCKECIDHALRCPNGHLLQTRPATATCGIRCDGCKGRFSQGEESKWCRACNYDLCKECNKALQCPNGHALQARPAGPTTQCDGCKRLFSDGEESKWCRACNYDLCKECIKALRCPSGHTLQARPAGPTTQCDGCKRMFSDGEESKWCRACSYDLCKECALRCPNGHALQPHHAGLMTVCDGCKRRFSVGEETKRCRACDYDLCKECRQGGTQISGGAKNFEGIVPSATYVPIKDFVKNVTPNGTAKEVFENEVVPALSSLNRWGKWLSDEAVKVATSIMESGRNDRLTPSQAYAVALYTLDVQPQGGRLQENFYHSLNAALQTREPRVLAELEGYLHYFIGALEALVPEQQRIFFRGVPKGAYHLVKENYCCGQRIHWSGVTSLSEDEAVSLRFALADGKIGADGHGGVLFRVTARSGRRIAHLSPLPEKEVLLLPNFGAVVTSDLYRYGDVWAIDILEVKKDAKTYVF